jgi:hypothetical protein
MIFSNQNYGFAKKEISGFGVEESAGQGSKSVVHPSLRNAAGRDAAGPEM